MTGVLIRGKFGYRHMKTQMQVEDGGVKTGAENGVACGLTLPQAREHPGLPGRSSEGNAVPPTP